MSATAREWSENPFRTREDILRAGITLVKPLEQYKSPQKARIKIPTATGTGFSEQAAQLEGFARPLWLVPHLILSGTQTGLDLQTWIDGLRSGTDPESAEYWGNLHGFDQRMVEMESIAYSLLVSPDAFRFKDDPETAEKLIAWLRQINDNDMSRNNWRWFRVLVNLALTRTLGVPLEDVKAMIRSDLALLDSFYLGHGWASDGAWGADRRQADYYSGSFAIQFAQLLYVRLAPDFDPERTQKYREQAAEFGVSFWRYFHENGASIPFGRSMTYRFAMGAFWAAAAAADVKFPSPLDKPGVVKGLLLRHLRWWSQQTDMFNTDGTLSIGFTYPNMYLSEDYNSPQSVYWCLKPFVVLALPEDHPFWQTPEEPHPSRLYPDLPHYHLIEEPRQLLCNTPQHHFLLSSGQDTKMEHKAREAKYGKFAYSSAFAFSVPVGPLLHQMAPDSTLALSFDGGDSWKVHWSPEQLAVGRAKVGSSGQAELPTLASVWKPWKFGVDVQVRTTLVPPVPEHPGWHVRVHAVQVQTSADQSWFKQLLCVEGGFAASAEISEGVSIFEKPCVQSLQDGALQRGSEGWWKDDRSALVISSQGASGVIDLSDSLAEGNDGKGLKASSEGTVMRVPANTNLLMQRTVLPAVKHSIDLDSERSVFVFATGVFAVEATAGKSHSEIVKLWQNPPAAITLL